MASIVFVFLDGVGLGLPEVTNPFWHAPMHATRSLLDGPLVSGAEQSRPGLHLAALDALLGVAGTPQSATGQTALFTGINAPELLGYHLPAFPNERLRQLIQKGSLLRIASEQGHRATFANAYSPLYFEMVRRTKRRMSATTYAVLGADIPFRWLSDLENGQAVYWDITNEHLVQNYDVDVPIITPEQAGRNLAAIAATNDLVLYESFLPDKMGHGKRMDQSVSSLERLDRFLGSLWESLPADATVVLSSDHGNIEDITKGIHTTNPVPLLVVGPGADAFHEARAITDVVVPILKLLER